MASALARPLVTTIRAVSPDAPLDEALDDAVAAGILHVRGDHVGFVHSPVRGGDLRRSSRGRRHRLHASIAAVVKDLRNAAGTWRWPPAARTRASPMRSRRRRARAGSRRSRRRRRAARPRDRLHPPGDDEPRIRRLLAAADERARIGEPATAAAHAAAAAEPRSRPAPSRGAVEGRRADRGHRRRRHGRGTSTAALDEPELEDATRCRIHAELSRVQRDLGRPEDAHRHAAEALALPRMPPRSRSRRSGTARRSRTPCSPAGG